MRCDSRDFHPVTRSCLSALTFLHPPPPRARTPRAQCLPQQWVLPAKSCACRTSLAKKHHSIQLESIVFNELSCKILIIGLASKNIFTCLDKLECKFPSNKAEFWDKTEPFSFYKRLSEYFFSIKSAGNKSISTKGSPSVEEGAPDRSSRGWHQAHCPKRSVQRSNGG